MAKKQLAAPPKTTRVCDVPRATQQPDGTKRIILADADKVFEDAQMLHLYGVLESVVKAQADWALGDTGDCALYFVRKLIADLKPRDALEEMLVMQMVLTHFRHLRLSLVACDQVYVEKVRVVHNACNEAANTYRRLMQTFADYRRPARQKVFVVAKQANVSEQQVVQNAEDANFKIIALENEQGLPGLLALSEGAQVIAGGSEAQPALEAQHRPENGGGEASGSGQLPQAGDVLSAVAGRPEIHRGGEPVPEGGKAAGTARASAGTGNNRLAASGPRRRAHRSGDRRTRK